MASYAAVCGRTVHWGSLDDCMRWARAQGRPVKLLRARAGEPSALVIGEVSADGFRPIRDGRVVPVSKLRAHRG